MRSVHARVVALGAALAIAAALLVIAPPAYAGPGLSSLSYDGEFVMTIRGNAWFAADEEGQPTAQILFSQSPVRDANGWLDADYVWDVTAAQAQAGRVEVTLDPSSSGQWYVQFVASGPGPLCVCDDTPRCASNVLSVRNVLPNAQHPSTTLGGNGLLGSDRTAGTNRYETAQQISRLWGRADVVYVATGEGFADALAAGPAAAFEGAPILLAQRDALPSSTAAELVRLAPARVVLVGGTAAISTSVAWSIDMITGTVVRVAGVDRYATATALASYVFHDHVLTAYVASGRAFADPIITGAAAALAYRPLLLVDGTRPLEAVVDAELRRMAVTNIVAVGPDRDLQAALPGLQAIAPVHRVAQENLYERSAALWDDVQPPVYEVLLATSGSFADALAGTPFAAVEPFSYLMLTEPGCVPAPVHAQILRLNPDYLRVLGGTAAVSDAVAADTPC